MRGSRKHKGQIDDGEENYNGEMQRGNKWGEKSNVEWDYEGHSKRSKNIEQLKG